MVLTYDILKDKILGCWTGKNIGGVLGGPDEGCRRVNDLEFYKQEWGDTPPANDDLDLQLVWLNACERFGKRVDSSILGEYWLSFIIPDWVEYGTGKANMRAGLRPPISGYFENPYRNSCGCFIRSELWACLYPGNPEEAVRYAYEDAIVDHAEDGMYGEVFCAAVQSAAFVCSDRKELIQIGLSYIPETSAVAKAVKTALQCYEQGADWIEARKRVMTEVPGSFGVQGNLLKDIPTDLPAGKPGEDAANNIGLMIIGWLYGENDFGKSICIAANCGEDTDCTAATLGAILGIIHGAKALPEKWTAPLGDKISTCCIKLVSGIDIPDDVHNLTDRVLRLIPEFNKHEYNKWAPRTLQWTEDGLYTLEAKEDLYCPGELYIHHINGDNKPKKLPIQELVKLSPYAVKYEFPMFTVIVDYMGEPVMHQGKPRDIRIRILDSGLGMMQQQFANIRFYPGDGVTIQQGNYYSGALQSLYRYELTHEITVMAEEIKAQTVDIVMEIQLAGRHTDEFVKISLLAQ